MSASTKNTTYIPSLDGLRGVAALSIVLLHFSSYLFPLTGNVVEGFTPILKKTYLLVDLFFILSGFVLSLKYTDIFIKGIQVAPYAKFMTKRFFRIYPLHLATLLFLFVLHRWFVPLYPEIPPDNFQVGRGNFSLATNFVLLHSSGLGDQGCFNCTSWNYPSWSISVEWLSYFLVPPIIIVFARLKKIMLPVCAIGILGLYYFIEVPVGHLDVASTPGWYRCLIGMFIGVCIQRLGYMRFQSSKSSSIMVFVVLALAFHHLESDTLLVLGIALFLLVVVNSKEGGILNSKILQWLGERSYSIYLIHVPVQDLMSFFIRLNFEKPPQGLGLLAQSSGLVVATALTLIASKYSYLYIERPFLGKKTSLLWVGQRLAVKH